MSASHQIMNPTWTSPTNRDRELPSAPTACARLLAFLAICALSLPASAAPVRPLLNITGYIITADLDPSTGKLTATADVTFTAAGRPHQRQLSS